MQQTIPANDTTTSSHVGTTPSTGPFAVDFPFFSLNDVVVTSLADGLDPDLAVTLVRGADYSLTGVSTDDGSFSSGTITLTLAVSSTTITRYRTTPVERLSNFPLQGFFSRLSLNAELNKITAILQEIERESGENDSELAAIEIALAGITNLHVGPTPPGDPTENMFWWSSELGQLFIWYDDGDTSQWVPASPIPATPVSMNVKDFGVRGDGITDDTIAIQAVIDRVYGLGGGTIVFPTGVYKLSASTLGETYDNANTVFLSSACALVQRAGVSLMGQPDRSAKLTTADATLVIVAQVAPLHCVIEGFEIYSTWTVGASGAGMGVMTLGTAGGALRRCVNNRYRNLFIHNVGSYGIGLQNGSPVSCRIENIDVYYTGADGIDLKSRGQIGTSHPVVQPVGNSVINCRITYHGNRVTGSCGIDIRGVWHLSGISVTDFGGDPTLEYEGIRFRTYPDPAANGVEDWLEAGRYGTLTGFYIKPTPGAPALLTNGVQTGSDDVHISNGTVDGCTNNYAFIGNVINNSDDCTLANVTSLNALIYGCSVGTSCARNRLIGFTSKSSLTAGIRNQGDYTYIAGWTSLSDATPLSLAAVASPTQVMINGPGNSSIQIGANTVQARLGINAPMTGNATSYGILVNPAVQSDVTATGTGYGTSLSTQATTFSTTLRHFAAVQGAFGAGSTVTSQIGFYAHAGLVGGTTNYGFYSGLPVGASNWNVRAEGTAQNWFAGNVGVGAGQSVPTAALDITPATTTQSGLRVRHGAAPTTPNDGDMWTTTAGMFVRINGVTKTVTLT